MTYIEATQKKWESLNKEQREIVLRECGCEVWWARSFDLYGDMPISVSEKLVRYYIKSQRV